MPKNSVLSSLWSRLRILAPVPVLCLIFVIACTVTVYAAVRFLSAGEAAEEMHYTTVADAFQHEDAITINETQTSGKYDITLLGITFGSAIQEVSGYSYPAGDAYAVVAVSYADGSPMPDISDDRWLEEVPDFYMTFLANGYSVIDNPLDRRSSGSFFSKDGVTYYLILCEGLSDYADSGIYFAVNEGISCSGFVYDESLNHIVPQENSNQIQALFTLSIQNSIFDDSRNSESSMDQTTPVTEHTSQTAPDTPSDHTVFGEFPLVSPAKAPWTAEQIDILNNASFEGRVWHITDDLIITMDRERNSSEKLIDYTVRIYDMNGSLLREKHMKTENRWPWYSWNTYTDTGFVVATDNVYKIYDYDFQHIGTVDPATIPTTYSYQRLTSKVTTTDDSGKESTYEIGYSFPRAFHCSFSSNLQYFIVTLLVNPTETSQCKESWLYDISADRWTKLFYDQPETEHFDCFSMHCMVPSDDGKTAAFTAGYLQERVPGTSQMLYPCYGLFSLESKQILMHRDGEVNKIHSLGNTFCMMPYDETTPAITRWYSVLDPSTNTEYRTKAVKSQKFESPIISPDGNHVMFCHSIADPNPAKQCERCRMYNIHTTTFSESFSLPLDGDILMDEYGYVVVPGSYHNASHIFGS